MRAVELMYLLTVVHNRNAYLAPVVASGDETNVNHILQLVVPVRFLFFSPFLASVATQYCPYAVRNRGYSLLFFRSRAYILYSVAKALAL